MPARPYRLPILKRFSLIEAENAMGSAEDSLKAAVACGD